MVPKQDTLKWRIHGKEPSDHHRSLINAIVFEKDYIWNVDCFNFAMTGSLTIGNCIQDLWFATYLLLRISTVLPDCAITVTDDDGEFLLIEASKYLSEFQPENVENRVWIHVGKLHIIPLCFAVDSVPKALDMVKDDSITTLAPQEVHQAALARTLEFEASSFTNIHSQNVMLPRAIAHILDYEESLITPIAHAFMEYCQIRLNLETLKNPSKEAQSCPEPSLVKYNVKFTRLVYAQLMSVDLDSKINKEYDLGKKIKLGFNLCHSSSASNDFADTVKQIMELTVAATYPEISDDSDKWMYMDNEELDRLNTCANLSISDDESGLDSDSSDEDETPKLNKQEREQMEKVGSLMSSFEKFSSIESDTRGIIEEGDESPSEDDEPIEFDADVFMQALSANPHVETQNSEYDDEQEQTDAELHMNLKSGFEEVEREVDVETNLIKNILASMEMQQGGPGPSTTLFNNLGVRFQ
jgi:SGT1 protein